MFGVLPVRSRTSDLGDRGLKASEAFPFFRSGKISGWEVLNPTLLRVLEEAEHAGELAVTNRTTDNYRVAIQRIQSLTDRKHSTYSRIEVDV